MHLVGVRGRHHPILFWYRTGELRRVLREVRPQIVGIVDVYDALTSQRPYRGALPAEMAARHLLREVEQGKFERGYVEAFLDAMRMSAAAPVH